ncbi:MAG: hypothetical protein LRS46_00010 [Desulfurococcales archaeon]|nr:hypothetical protein [Desulfurococcales archaeon]
MMRTPAPVIRQTAGGRGRRVREVVSDLSQACSLTQLPLSEEEKFLLREIARYAREGLGALAIGRRLWPSLNPRTAQKRVQRMIARWERLVRLSCRRGVSEPFFGSETSRRRWIRNKDGSVPPSTMLLLPEEVVEGRVVKLGRTQRLVLAALNSLGGRARFSAILSEYLELAGLENTVEIRERYKNRVWHALRRLAARGLVGFEGGVYWLSGPLKRSNVVVENFRGISLYGGEIQVWSKREHGRALPLSEALILAVLRGVTRVTQVELAEAIGDEENLDRYGVSIVKIYRDRHHPYNGRWKIEASLSNPPLKPRLEDYNTWLRAWELIKQGVRKLSH